MDTKRCTNCHKLLRAETEVCSRCGYTFTEKKQLTPVRTMVKRSIPPASPHRAGHYSGLHPEDQPYQSAMIAVQRPPANTAHLRGSLPKEPEEKQLSTVDTVNTVNTVLETDWHYQVTLATPLDIPQPIPYIPPSPNPTTPLPPSQYLLPPPRRMPRGRFVPTVLTISCLLLLVASSLLAFIYLNRKPIAATQVLSAIPNQLRVNDTFTLSGKGFGVNDLISFTYDENLSILDGSEKPLQAHADDTGSFSIQITVPTNWSVGPHKIFAIDIGKEQSVSVLTTITIEQPSPAPPLLHLLTSSIDLGANAPGAVVKKNIQLINAGGQQVSWKASSDQPWLTLSPISGTFSGSTIAQVTVNSGSLTPQSYAGHITFTQSGSDHPLKLTVTMSVKAAPPTSLTIAPVALTYSGITTQNPTSQVVTLQNTNSQPLDWSSAVSTGDGSNWLSINPASDHLAAHSSETVTVDVQTLQLAIGSYQGTINFKGGTNPSVTVALSVAAPGYLVTSPPALSFTSIGQNPAAQMITMQNSGGGPLDWSAATATVDRGHWLLLSPASGHLEAGQSGNIAVTINVSGLKPQSYQGTLTFTYGGGLTKLVPIALTVSVPPAAAISLSPGTMNFSTLAGTNPAPQVFTITNTGNATLNWAVAEDQNGATFAPLSATSGSLAPTKSIAITVSPTIGLSGAGVLTTNITVFDRDTGSKVLAQKIPVTIIIKDQPMISLSMSTMSFSHDSTITESSQLLVITNTGTQTLNWATQPSASWLSADVTSGVLAPGASITIDVHCNSSTLAAGNFPATFVVSDSDAGTTVTPQTVTVNLTVS